MNIDRKTGYYWVRPKFIGTWWIAYWGNDMKRWLIQGQMRNWYDKDFIEIKEYRLPEPGPIVTTSSYYA